VELQAVMAEAQKLHASVSLFQKDYSSEASHGSSIKTKEELEIHFLC